MDGMAVKRRKTKVELKSDEIRIRVTAAEKEAWTLAAKADNRELSGWLRHLASEAVRK
jgi:hypothetical protein